QRGGGGQLDRLRRHGEVAKREGENRECRFPHREIPSDATVFRFADARQACGGRCRLPPIFPFLLLRGHRGDSKVNSRESLWHGAQRSDRSALSQMALKEFGSESGMFRGSITALVTPFRQDGSLDRDAFTALIEWQITEGSNGLVPVGTTGESPTLRHEDHYEAVRLCVEAAAGRVPVIAGAGSNSTREAIAFV